MPRIVSPWMPNPCGPWNASPESFSRMRLYAGLLFFEFLVTALVVEAMSLRFLRPGIPGIVTNYPRPRTSSAMTPFASQNAARKERALAQPERSLNIAFDSVVKLSRARSLDPGKFRRLLRRL